MAEANETVVRRLMEEVLNRGQTGLLAELVAADHVGHDPLGDHYGPEGLRIVIAEHRAAFPDLRVTVEDIVAEGDKVVRRFTLRGTHGGPFMGIPATGRAVTAAGIAIDRLVPRGHPGSLVGSRWASAAPGNCRGAAAPAAGTTLGCAAPKRIRRMAYLRCLDRGAVARWASAERRTPLWEVASAQRPRRSVHRRGQRGRRRSLAGCGVQTRPRS